MKKIRMMSLLMTAVIGNAVINPAVICTESYAADSITVAERTPQEIKQYITSHPSDVLPADEFEVQPSAVFPYAAGSPKDEAIQNALNYLNCVRYIAGLPEVSLNSEYNKLAQYASLVDCANDVLTHFPEQPADMPDDIYTLGAEGACSSNIARMGKIMNMAYSVELYMYDSNEGNIPQLSHRRWCLNPKMSETGFGIVGRYSTMYVFDMNRQNATEKGVCWPAQNMPIEYFEVHSSTFDMPYAWSISMGKNLSRYDIKVSLTRRSDSMQWNFSSDSADGYFYVDNDNYGQRGCIIFSPPDISYNAGDVFDVRIEGMEEPVEYTVNFFSLSENPDVSGENLTGDVNKDGKLNVADLVILEKWLLSADDTEIEDWKTADLNSDNVLDVFDLCLMRKALIE